MKNIRKNCECSAHVQNFFLPSSLKQFSVTVIYITVGLINDLQMILNARQDMHGLSANKFSGILQKGFEYLWIMMSLEGWRTDHP